LKGQPISSFWGYQIQGIFQDEGEVAAAPAQPGEKKVGRWRFADVNGDNVVDAKDETFLGNPHPAFTYGLNLDLSWKNFDFSAFFQGSQGNEIFNYTRYWIDFETFNGNRSIESLTDSWTPNNRNASLPRLDFSDQISNQFATSYYIEDGSYLALRQAQLGYTFQSIGKMKVDRLRVYLQATNPIMITNYRGYNPAFTVANADDGNADRTMGVDYGYYPIVKQFIIGANLTF
jgi:TonB-dependent starch-binding outer membrane protein SusC